MLTALAQVSFTILHRFTNSACTAQFSSAVTIAPSLHCPLSLWYMHMVTCCDTQLHNSCCPLALHATLCTSLILYSLLVGIFPEHYGSIYLSPHSGGGTPGRVTSEASRVIMLLDVAAFCYSIIISPMKNSPDWYTSNCGSRLWFAYFCLFPSLFLYLPFLFLIFFFVHLQHL
jgi:hypothetical protein